MKPSIYLETTVFGYLAMRLSSVLRTAANQETTRDWWDHSRQNYELFVSRFVVEECGGGRPRGGTGAARFSRRDSAAGSQ